MQIAKAKRAKVWPPPRCESRNSSKSWGDVTIDYATQKFEEIAKNAGGIDVVLDTRGGDTQKRSFEVLKRWIAHPIVGGRIRTCQEKGVHASEFLVKPDAAELAQIAKWIDAGKIKVTISHVVPLADAAKAPPDRDRTHRGKIVLKVAEADAECGDSARDDAGGDGPGWSAAWDRS